MEDTFAICNLKERERFTLARIFLQFIIRGETERERDEQIQGEEIKVSHEGACDQRS